MAAIPKTAKTVKKGCNLKLTLKLKFEWHNIPFNHGHIKSFFSKNGAPWPLKIDFKSQLIKFDVRSLFATQVTLSHYRGGRGSMKPKKHNL